MAYVLDVVVRGHESVITESVRGLQDGRHVDREKKWRGVDTAPGNLRPVSEGVQVNHCSLLRSDVATPRATGALPAFVKNSLLYNATLQIQVYHHQRPSGFAHFRFSMCPVLGHRISCQDTGSIVEPSQAR